VIDVLNGPVLQAFENRLLRNQNRIQTLEDEKKKLQQFLNEGNK